MPSTRISPLVGERSPAIASATLVRPLLVAPVSPITSPRFTLNDTAS